MFGEGVTVVAANPDAILTEGLYTIDQAARLARLSPQILYRWFDGTSDSPPAMIRRIPKNGANVVSFIDLMQALAIRALRKQNRISLQKVRLTVKAAEQTGHPHPFALQHRTFLFDDDIVIELYNGDLIQVTGKYKQQQLIRPVVELYLEDVGFDLFGKANSYTPMREGDRKIVIQPTIKFGAPVVMPCGYTVSAILDAVESEGSIEAAASAFEIEQDDVKFALRYDDLLAGIAA